MYNHEEVLRFLSPQDKEELAMWEGLIAHPGFKLLIHRVSSQYDSALGVLANAPNWDAYTYARGIRDSLAAVINLEAFLEFSVHEKLEEAKAAILEPAGEDFV